MSLWFRPVLFVTLGIVLGLSLPTLDRNWPGLGQELRSFWLALHVPTTTVH